MRPNQWANYACCYQERDIKLDLIFYCYLLTHKSFGLSAEEFYQLQSLE